MLSLGLGDFWGKSQGKGLAASGSLLVVVGVVLSCHVARPLSHFLPSPRSPFQIATPRIMSGNGNARKVFPRNHGPSKSRNSQSHQTQLVGFR